jgi:hypothetical protein
MRVVIGVDWSEQAFAAVTQTFHLYRPTDVTLVHGVELGILKHPFVAQAGNVQGYEDFRNAMVESGNQLLERAAGLVPVEVPSIRKINEIDSPAQLILDSAENSQPTWSSSACVDEAVFPRLSWGVYPIGCSCTAPGRSSLSEKLLARFSGCSSPSRVERTLT